MGRISNILIFVFFFLSMFFCRAQELYPLNEPASSIPKGVLGVRVFGNTYQEISTQRNMAAVRIMYGVTPRLSVMATTAISNHHNKSLPADLVNHIHVGNQTFFFTQNIQRGVKYPYLLNGLHLYAKYRFLSIDGKHRHLRMALYSEWSNTKSAHDEAEPNLMDDSKGFGSGLIITALKDHFAISLTSGFILSGAYKDMAPLGVGYDDWVPTEVHYGNALIYNLSLGYLLYPRNYTDYHQSNWNIYLEFMGKAYEEGKLIQNGVALTHEGPAMKAGNYIEVHPGLQRIINSNLRIEISAGFPLLSRSYIRFYPVISVGVQQYFY